MELIKLRNAAFWGIGCIVSEFLVLTQKDVANSGLDPFFRFFWFEASIALAIVTYCLHIWGYRRVGKKWNSGALSYSAGAIAVFTMLLGAVLLYATWLTSFQLADPFTLKYLNYGIGFVILLLLIASIPFVLAFWQHRHQIPTWSFLSLGILAFPFFLWQAWPTIIFLIPSILFLFQQYKSSS